MNIYLFGLLFMAWLVFIDAVALWLAVTEEKEKPYHEG